MKEISFIHALTAQCNTLKTAEQSALLDVQAQTHSPDRCLSAFERQVVDPVPSCVRKPGRGHCQNRLTNALGFTFLVINLQTEQLLWLESSLFWYLPKKRPIITIIIDDDDD